MLVWQESPKNGVLAVQTLRNNIMASTLLASTAIMLTSLIGILMTGGNGDRSVFFAFDDKSNRSFSYKFFAILVCFLVAFLFNVQSVRATTATAASSSTRPTRRCRPTTGTTR